MKTKRRIVKIRNVVKPVVEPVINPIRDLAESGRLSGVLLLVATAVALVWANSSEGNEFLAFWEQKIGMIPLDKTISHWVNDGLMAVFFFFVGLEIKREILAGELSDWRHIFGLGITAGIGFTMSIFIAGLSFPDAAQQSSAKLAIMAGTVLSGVVGLLWLVKVDRAVSVGGRAEAANN